MARLKGLLSPSEADQIIAIAKPKLHVSRVVGTVNALIQNIFNSCLISFTFCILLIHLYCTIVLLLLYCSCTFVELLFSALRANPACAHPPAVVSTATSLWLKTYCYTIVPLLLHLCSIVVTLLLQCCYTVVTLSH
jgi:hypothetical protein